MTFSTNAIAAICISSHLTLFTLKDESPAAKAVENSIQSLQKRFEIIADTDLFDDETTVNFPVLAIFGVCTVITVVVTSFSKRRIAQNDLRTARKVYIQEGILKKPNVIGSLEMEAIFRGRLSFPKVAFIIFLQIVTSNPFLSFFFRWSHQAIVYTQADKAMVLYSAVLMTFLSSAFFF